MNPGRVAPGLLAALLAWALMAAPPTSAQERVRRPAVAGAFYPAEARQLRDCVQSFLEGVERKPLEGRIIALVCPHAGYPYSGPVAAYAYSQLRGGGYDTVVLIGPCHRGRPFTGVSVGDFDAYETPLGTVPVDRKLAKELIGSSELVRFLPDRHQDEHSLEVQLPFLQTVLEDFEILAVLTGDFSLNTCRKVAGCLHRATREKNVLFIASTDLSHYLARDEAVALDGRTVQAIKEGAAEPLYYGLRNKNYSMCGGTAVVTLLLALAEKGPFEAELLKYANSGDTGGPEERVVGYAALAFLEEEAEEAGKSETNPHKKDRRRAQPAWQPLSPESQRRLLGLARRSIREYLTAGRLPEVDPEDYPECRDGRGVFVTLHKGGRLRGCVGCHASHECLCRMVPYMAARCACADPRFSPLQASELGEVTIEINVYLTPLIPIQGPDAFEPGAHGIELVKGHRSATFLPHVASQQGWNREQTLCQLCRKARLPADAWRDDDVELYVYKTQSFQEKNDE